MSKSVSTNVFKKKTGIQNIQAYLESGRSITALEALSNFGIFRLASAIEVLRKRGLPIATERKEDPNGKTYARYTLQEKAAEVGALEAKHSKFKVGDRVADTGFLANFEGGVVTAVVNDPDRSVDYEVKFDRWGHCAMFENELTLIPAEPPKKELKVGARVRDITYDVGFVGTVTSVTFCEEWPIEVNYAGLYKASELEVI